MFIIMKKILSIFTVLFLLSACGKDDENETAPDIDDTPSAKSSDDYRGLMRDFVTSISKKGKAAIPGFAVIPQNGIQLVATGDEPDTPLAEQYLAAIDGHGQEDIFMVRHPTIMLLLRATPNGCVLIWIVQRLREMLFSALIIAAARKK